MTKGAGAAPFTDSRIVLRSLATDQVVVEDPGGRSVVEKASLALNAIATPITKAKTRL